MNDRSVCCSLSVSACCSSVLFASYKDSTACTCYHCCNFVCQMECQPIDQSPAVCRSLWFSAEIFIHGISLILWHGSLSRFYTWMTSTDDCSGNSCLQWHVRLLQWWYDGIPDRNRHLWRDQMWSQFADESTWWLTAKKNIVSTMLREYKWSASVVHVDTFLNNRHPWILCLPLHLLQLLLHVVDLMSYIMCMPDVAFVWVMPVCKTGLILWCKI